ncbi:SMP-30/gluconolactonase/LRE family protein [Ideonella sp. DXS29W]|uniref:SMP-30/gluconolactonase/LRE family protein n=1 Tax=Ideonella lacteola TaxID=2984193 RepID=A0ABU9BYD9_9BURK
MTTVERLVEAHADSVGESPLWHAGEAAWYWVDIEGCALRRWRSGLFQSWTLGERIACLALHAHGGLVAGLESRIVHLALRDDGGLTIDTLAELAHPKPGMRFNDGRCDRAGRFFAGTMLRDMAAAQPVGALYRFDARGPSQPLIDGLIVPNGLAFSADGRTMYLSDSHPRRRLIWAFDVDAQGMPQQRRLFVDMNHHPGRPDGAAIDADGCYWICANDAGLVHRFTPDGRLDRSIAVPTAKPSMCSFGGAHWDELLITSIRPAGDTSEAAGATYIARPGVQGLPETPWTPHPG